MRSVDPITSLYHFPATKGTLSPRVSCPTSVASLPSYNTVEMEKHDFESNCLLPNTKLVGLINEISKMAKNPSLDSDLGKVLDNFLKKIQDCSTFFQCGLFNMNFAEAALFVKGSGDLYGKRVDLLWDGIFEYQKRIISKEKNIDKAKELEQLEERRRKYKRKRKTQDDKETTQLINNFSFPNVDYCDYLHEKIDRVNLTKEWHQFKSQVNDITHQVANRQFVFLPETPLHNRDFDYVGKYSQFHSTTLIDDILYLEEEGHLGETDNIRTIRIDTHIVCNFLHEKQLSNEKADERTEEISEYISDALSAHTSPIHTDTPIMNQDSVSYKKSYVCLERIPISVMKAQLRRISLADSLFDDDPKSPGNDELENCEMNPTLAEVTKSLEVRSKSCSQDSAFYEDFDHTCNDHDEVPVDENHNDNSNVELVKESIAKELQDSPSSNETTVDLSRPSADVEKQSDNTEVPVVVRQSRRKKTMQRDTVLNGQIEKTCKKKNSVVRRRRLSKKALQSLVVGVTADLRNFENFCRTVYKPAEGEGIVPEVERCEGDDEDEASEDDSIRSASPTASNEATSDMDVSDDNDQAIAEENAFSNDEEDANMECETFPEVRNSPIRSNSFHDTEHFKMITSTPCSPGHRFGERDFEREENSRKTINEWRSFIIPKIKTMENRADFNIHDYGKSITDSSEIGEEQMFKDLVKGKSTSEVARYFIATLHLANMGNIQICGAVPGKISNDSFKVKTLDKTRHDELLEDYQAPSEEIFEKQLKRAKDINLNKTAKRVKLSF